VLRDMAIYLQLYICVSVMWMGNKSSIVSVQWYAWIQRSKSKAWLLLPHHITVLWC